MFIGIKVVQFGYIIQHNYNFLQGPRRYVIMRFYCTCIYVCWYECICVCISILCVLHIALTSLSWLTCLPHVTHPPTMSPSRHSPTRHVSLTSLTHPACLPHVTHLLAGMSPSSQEKAKKKKKERTETPNVSPHHEDT